jgi:hypothetical protein
MYLRYTRIPQVKSHPLRATVASPALTADLQHLLVARGVELSWPDHVVGY